MDNKLVYTATIKNHQQEQETLSVPTTDNGNFSQPPKVTVLLPEHAASRLRDLVQKRDIALLRLGIISVQFENDQIISLEVSNSTILNSNQPKQQQQQRQQQESLAVPIAESIIGTSIDNCNTDCIGSLKTAITTLKGLGSPNHQDLILEDDENLKSNLDTSNSPILQLPVVTTIAATTTTTTTTTTVTTPTKTTTTNLQKISDTNSGRNSSNIDVAYVEEEEDDKDEDEAVGEVGNHHSSYNIHQLSQLEFSDPIELDMYDNDNLLFPDYTLNLS